MTDTERKALALLREVAGYEIDSVTHDALFVDVVAALCRAIEQHEAFRQEVSDAMLVLQEFITGSRDHKRGSRTDSVRLADGRSVEFARFIIAKPDPLVEVLDECGFGVSSNAADDIRAAIEKRGGRIVFDGSGA